MSDVQMSAAHAAEHLGLKVGTLHAYRRDGLMPSADGMIGRTPWWWQSTIDTWWQSRPGRGTGGGRPRRGQRVRAQSSDILPFGFGDGLGSGLAVYGLLRRFGQAEVSIGVSRHGNVQIRAPRVDLAAVARSAAPRAVFSPWGAGSGFIVGGGSVGAVKILDAIRQSTHPDLDIPRQGLAVMDELVAHQTASGAIAGGKIVDKTAIVRAVRRGLSGPIADWPRSCVDVYRTPKGEEYTVNPLTCTGGNAGRTDFSAIYHDALLALASAADGGLGSWRDLVAGTEVAPLLERSPSAFLSELYADRGLMNPAWVVCAIEGMSFARSATWSVAHAGTMPVPWPHIHSPSAIPVPGDEVTGTVFYQALLPVPPHGEYVTAHEAFGRWAEPYETPGVGGWRSARYALGARGQVSQSRFLDVIDTNLIPSLGPIN
jgi:hypothetical protein